MSQPRLSDFREVVGKSVAFFAQPGWDQPILIFGDLVNELYMASLDHKKNVRICLHSDPSDLLHDMIVLERRNSNILGLHRHPNKTEHITVLRGELCVSKLNGLIMLGPLASIFIPLNVWHSTRPYTDYVVYRELKPGPFRSEDNELWTPPNPS